MNSGLVDVGSLWLLPTSSSRLSILLTLLSLVLCVL